MTRAIRDRYALEREIGRGAFGSIWVARDLQLGRDVALKLLSGNARGGRDARAPFEQEAWAAAQLRSPHIVQIYDLGVEGDQPFIVMELLEGETLETRLHRHPRLPLSVVVGIVGDIAKGLATSHRASIVHRDVKPSNVFLAREGGREIAKLLDFGVAMGGQHAAGSATGASARSAGARSAGARSALVGTPQYMSPEQFRGAAIDARADLWALAILAYQMLTGAHPFQRDGLDAPRDGLEALRDAVCSSAFRPASGRCPELPASVDAFFARAFAEPASERFRSAEEFASEFIGLASREAEPVLRLLFVDDEPDMQFLVRQRFRQLQKNDKYELIFATDAELALDELRRRPDIDVVLTDLNMPGMDGLTFLSHVPAANPFARVVVVSAYSDMANIRAAMNQGSFDFLGKPIDFEDLARTIEKCGRHVRALRQMLQSGEENDILKAMVGRGMADRLINSVRANDNLRLESFEAAVAFVDVHGFARTLEHLPPEAIFEHLNAHFSLFVPELLARGGTVSRFVGDAVMAFFEGSDYLNRAVEACLAIRDRLRMLNTDGSPQSGRYGVTMGLDAGTVFAGGAGSLAMGRLEPSLVGGAVSTAARLQGMARNHELLVSARVQAIIAPHYRCELDESRSLASAEGASPVARVVGREVADDFREGPRTTPLSFAS